VLGDVFVERAGGGARGHDALDGVMLEGAEGGGVSERGVEIGGGVALAEQQDLASLVSPEAHRPGAQETKEVGRALAHLAIDGAELVLVDGAFALGERVQALGVEPEPLAPPCELVTRNAGEIGGVDEELALGDADGQEVRHVLVGDRIVIAVPGDKAVDATDAIDDPGGVIRVPRQSQQVLALAGKPIEGSAPMAPPQVDDGVEPAGELGLQVVEVGKRAAIEKRALDFPEAALDPGLVIGVGPAHGLRSKLVVSGVDEEAWIVDGLLSLPA